MVEGKLSRGAANEASRSGGTPSDGSLGAPHDQSSPSWARRLTHKREKAAIQLSGRSDKLLYQSPGAHASWYRLRAGGKRQESKRLINACSRASLLCSEVIL